MPRNKLSDLNNLLFEQLERLNDEDLTGEELDREIKRANSVTNIAEQIVETHRVVIDAQKIVLEHCATPQSVQALIEMK